jgi:hypothetical protein
MVLARMLKTVMTATVNASQTQTVMESATHLKSLVAPTRLPATSMQMLQMTMGHAPMLIQDTTATEFASPISMETVCVTLKK